MGKKPTNNNKATTPTGEQVMTEEDLQKMMAADDNDSVSSESDDDELLLEGELVRNPDVSSSSSEDEDDDDEGDSKPAAQSNNTTSTSPKRKIPPASAAASKKKKKKKSKKDDDITNVEFIFCDTQEKYWDGCKALLMNSSTVYQRHASIWSDWLSQQIVGTVVSTPQASDEDSVFGFASLVAVHATPLAKEPSETTTQRADAMKFLQQYAISECPSEYEQDMKRLFDLKSLYLFLHGRMINLPLEIVLVLHEQLWLDWEYAHEDDTNTTQGGKKKQKKQLAAATPVIQGDAPRILRMAPCTKSNGDIMYRYYDDELLAGRAIVSYTVKAPKSYSREEALFLQVMVLSVDNYKQAIDDFKVLVGNNT